MARADLHYAVALDQQIYEASQVDPTLLDPLVRVEGALPGTAQPITIVREYQGPQGSYLESFRLTDRHGRELYRSLVTRIELRGEMFEDRFVNTVSGLRFTDAEEHTLTFFINDEEVGSVPVFVEAGLGGDPYIALEQTVTKALQKGTILWLRVPQRPDRRGRPAKPHDQPAWFVLERGNVYVLTGPGEQQIAGLTEADEVELIVRSKDVRSRIADVPASVRIVPNDDPLFDRIGRAALGKRLNLPDGDAALERWRAQCTLVELTPRYRPAGLEPQQAAAPDRAAAASTPAGEQAQAGEGAPEKAAEEDIHVEAEIDQEVFDSLIASGSSERVARAKAKAAFVRKEKARIRAERETVSS
jgi:hypothetical protein